MLLLGYALAALIGLSLGLMGGGGSILTVPIFVYVLGYDPKLAIAMSLPVVGVTSLVGAAEYWRAGNVDLRTAGLFGALAMAGAFAGARLALFLSGAAQLTLLAVVMLTAAVFMFRPVEGVIPAAAEPVGTGGISLALLLPVAIAVGVLTGLVGTGGGFLMVPALVVLARVPIRQAVGTSLLVIAMNCASGFIGYSTHVDVPWTFLLGFTAVAVVGILAGARLVRFVAQGTLKRAFAVFLIIMGAFILVKNRHVFSAVTHRPAMSRGSGLAWQRPALSLPRSRPEAPKPALSPRASEASRGACTSPPGGKCRSLDFARDDIHAESLVSRWTLRHVSTPLLLELP